MPSSQTLRVSAALTVSGPVIRDAAIQIRNNRILSIGPWRDLPLRLRKNASELGDTLVLPGLVNAHCHLDYTHMAGQLPPQKSFTDWVKLIVSIKAGWSLDDFAASWKSGAEMLLRHGTTTVADIEAVPQLLPRMWDSTPLRVISFLEMIGISKIRPPEAVLRETLQNLRRLRPSAFQLGLSPHAPYSTTPGLLRLSCGTARRKRLLLSTHIAESRAEADMFLHARGEMFDWLTRSGRDMSDCGLCSPVAHVKSCGALNPELLAVHVNYLSSGDAQALGEKGVTVVHCPRSHFYFKHQRFPLEQLARKGVNICLGTDSLASVYKHKREIVELDMFAEMRELAAAHNLSPRRIVRMATLNGARALGLVGKVGCLQKGAFADLIALPLLKTSGDLYHSVLRHEGPVLGTMIDGRWAFSQFPK